MGITSSPPGEEVAAVITKDRVMKRCRIESLAFWFTLCLLARVWARAMMGIKFDARGRTYTRAILWGISDPFYGLFQVTPLELWRLTPLATEHR